MTDDQKAYLASLPPERANRIIRSHPYDPKIADLAAKVMQRIKRALPDADIRFMGASALGISGQNDIDIYVMTPVARYAEYVSMIAELFGSMKRKNKWTWFEEEIEVSVRAYDPDGHKEKRHLRLFAIFMSNPLIIKEYEALKQSMDGKTYREYQMAKYAFYNRTLGIET